MAAEGEAPVRLELALDPGSDPISGALGDGAGQQRPFRGWLQLIAHIEAAAASTPSPQLTGDETAG